MLFRSITEFTENDEGLRMLEETCRLLDRMDLYEGELLNLANESENPTLLVQLAQLITERGRTADAIRILLQQGTEVRCVRLEPDETRYDIGTPLTYYRAFADFALADPENGADFARYLREKLAQA